jgi:cell division protein FtsI (penicillin-binding protein 3)
MLRLLGYFPADNPKFSCIVVVHKPSTVNNNYYGADAGPVFKRIAQKILQMFLRQTKLKNIEKSLNRKKIITTTLLNYKATAVNS